MEETMEYNMDARCASTRMALLEALAKLGSHTTVNEDGSIHAWYQGKSIEIMISNYLVRIWDSYWRTYTPNDPEPHLRDAVNAANLGPLATLILSESEDKKLTYVHTKIDFMFPPGIPYPEDLLLVHLQELDRIQVRLDTHLQALNSNHLR